MPFPERSKAFLRHYLGNPQSGAVYRLVMEITNVCNLRCRMCPRNTMTRKNGHMDPHVFESIVQRNRRTLEFVSLNGYGEPLLSPNLFSFLRICRQNGVATGISTNCTALTAEKSEALLDNPPDLMILAVDGISPQTYEQIRVGACFDEVIANVKAFLKRCQGVKKRPFIVLQCISMAETRDEIRHFGRFFNGYPFDAIRIRQLTHTGNDQQDAAYTHRSSSCYWLWAEPMILQDGTLVPCCQDANGTLALGKVSDRSLDELWNHGRIEKLRALHASGQRDRIKTCRDCNMYQPGPLLASAAILFDTGRTNLMIPAVESMLAYRRYHIKR